MLSPVQSFLPTPQSVWLLSLCYPAEWLTDGCARTRFRYGKAKAGLSLSPISLAYDWTMGQFVPLEKCELCRLLEHPKWRGKKAVGAATAGICHSIHATTVVAWALSITGLSRTPDNPIFGDLWINTSFLSL